MRSPLALALLVIGVAAFAALPGAPRLIDAGAAMAGWSLAHWGCPPPMENDAVATCGFVQAMRPTP